MIAVQVFAEDKITVQVFAEDTANATWTDARAACKNITIARYSES
jgi:hypothetical protein